MSEKVFCPGSLQRVPVDPRLAPWTVCPDCKRYIQAGQPETVDGRRTGVLRKHVSQPAPTVWNRGARP